MNNWFCNILYSCKQYRRKEFPSILFYGCNYCRLLPGTYVHTHCNHRIEQANCCATGDLRESDEAAWAAAIQEQNHCSSTRDWKLKRCVTLHICTATRLWGCTSVRLYVYASMRLCVCTYARHSLYLCLIPMRVLFLYDVTHVCSCLLH
jgi:hypothetical protein